MALADLNRDGKLDLITQYAVTASDWDAGPFSTAVAIGRGTGRGTFARLAEYDGLDASAESLLAADFNHDGFLDLAMAVSGGLDVLLGNGDGTFQPPATFAGGSATPASAVLGDFNGDGRPDVLVGQWSQGAMKAGVVFLNATAKPSGAGVANGASS